MPTARLLMLALMLSACGTTADDGADAGDDAAVEEAVSLMCPLAADLGPGEHILDHEFDGMPRIVHLYVPPNYDASTRTPLVFNLHPFVLGDALLGIWKTESAMQDKADEEGFLVVTPSGTGGPSAWNGGEECCGQASTNEVNDVGFILHLIDYITERTCVDRARVYATGMSNGGYLSSRLACEASDRIAAIAPVVGHLSAELYPCELSRAMPVLHITGSEDSLPQRTEAFERWVEMDGCTDEAEEIYNDGEGAGSARCVSHDSCDDGAEVTHCVVEAGHCWQSNRSGQATPNCLPTQSFHSPDVIWEFFSRFALPADS